MKLNQIALTGCMLALLASPIRATTDSTLFTSQVTFNPGDKVTGSVAVIQAFSAIRENSAGQLLSALNSSKNPVNESFSITSNGKEIRLRLVHAAVLAKSPISLSLLISRGARIAAKDSLGKSAAHYACFGAPDFGDIFDFKPYIDGEVASLMLELLQAEGLEMDGKDLEQRTPLHFAAMSGDKAVIHRLTSFGVALDPKDIFGYTPTQLAVRAGYLAAIPQFLKRAGAVSTANSLDYLVGAKNDVASFILVHPIATAVSVIGSGLAWLSYGIVTAAKAVSTPMSRREPSLNIRPDGTLPPPDLGVPTRAFFGGSPGGGMSGSGSDAALLLGSLPSRSSRTSASASAPTSSRHEQKKEQSAADAAATSAATSPRATVEKKSSARQYKDATDHVNAVRRSQDLAQIQGALQEAEHLLREIRDQEIAEERRHLLAAISGLAKLLPEDNPERANANRIFEAYSKKAKRH